MALIFGPQLLSTDLKTKTAKKDELDTYPEIQALREQLKPLNGLKKTDPDYAKKKALRKEIIDKIEVLKTTGKMNKAALKVLKGEIKALKKQIGRLDGNVRKATEKLADASSAQSYGMVAQGGDKTGQDKTNLGAGNTGNLSALFQEDMKDMKHLVK